MRKLFHLLFDWDYVSLTNHGVKRIRVNEDGVPYVRVGHSVIPLSVRNYRAWRMFFVHGSVLDYFNLSQLEEICGTTN